MSSCQSVSPARESAAELENKNTNDSNELHFEATELSRCVDSKGNPTGSLNIVWQLGHYKRKPVLPYVVGFSGSLLSLQGTKIEFQSVMAAAEDRFSIPPVHNPLLFPLGSYAAFTLLFPFDEQDSGLAYLKINDEHVRPADVSGAQLLIPKFAIGGEYSTRFYMKVEGGLYHEFSCQAVTRLARERLSTFNRKDGQHRFLGDRGVNVSFQIVKPMPPPAPVKVAVESKKTTSPMSLARAEAAAEIMDAMTQPTPEPTPEPTIVDLRPVGRPVDYEKTFKHTRLFNCGKNGALDAIWKVRNDAGKEIPKQEMFISGFAAEIKDASSKNAFYFNSVSIVPAPAFYTGQMPNTDGYLFPAIEFNAEQVKQNLSIHSRIPGLKANEWAPKGTVYLPRDGSGKGVSVALALGDVVNAPSFQATADCTPATPRVKEILKHCLVPDASVRPEGLCGP
jgi:hypothetical protein